MAGVIKSGQLRESANTAPVAAFNFEDMASKADAYVASIRQKAARILAEAKQRAGEIEAAARQKGRDAAARDAEQSSQSRIEQRLETLLPALSSAIDSIRLARESWLQQWEHNTIRLAKAIAARVIRRELSHTPDISLEWMREALELVADQGRVTVHLHPADFEVLGESVCRLTERISSRSNSQIVADPAIERGGCRVETEFGCIDQQVSAQLDRIEQELTGEGEG